nr:hypothetical protein [Tanacetum cinerariifolium]
MKKRRPPSPNKHYPLSLTKKPSEIKKTSPKEPNESKPLEKVVIHNGHPDQTVIVGGNLTTKCRTGLIGILCKHADAFAWTPADMTGIPRFIVEHELKTYPHIEPRVQRKKSIAPDKKKMAKKDEEKTAFYPDEGVFCYTKMPFELKNDEATYQRMKNSMVYLSAANEAVSVILLVERNERQIPIHYVSRALQGAKINYPSMEKLALALVYTATRLRRYFQELEAYGIQYALRNAIKGQVLADFLADTMAEDSPAHTRAARKEETSMEGKVQEVRRTTEDQIPTAPPDETNIWKLYTDGASNDHGSGACLILIDPEGAEYSNALRLNFTNSNNDAEYEALLASLRITAKIKVEKMHSFVDSKLVASQVEGSYEARDEKIKKYREEVLKMVRSFSNFRIKELNERSIDMPEVNIIVEEAAGTWMTPIQEYIEKGILQKDTTEA